MTAVELCEAWRTVAAAVDDARRELDAGNHVAATRHVDVAIDARQSLAASGERVPGVVARELYDLRRALAAAAAPDTDNHRRG